MIKKEITTQAKKDLKKKLLDEYNILKKKIEEVEKNWWTVKEKLKNLRQSLENHLEYKEIVWMIDKYLKVIEKLNKQKDKMF